MKIRILVTVIIAALIVTACHSGRQVSGGNASAGAYIEAGSAKPLGESQLRQMLADLEAGYKDWDNVKVPVTLRLKSPKKFSVGGTLTMQRDVSIHISLRFLGMEMASLMVTQDSIYACYKLQRLYFAESIAGFTGGFPATVGNVQDLLLGRAFALGDKELTEVQCSLSGNGETWTAAPANGPDGIGYSFSIDTPTNNVETLDVSLPLRKPIEVRYSDFMLSASGPMAATADLSASTRKTTFSGRLSIDADRAEWGRGNVRQWTVPRGYTRVKASDIMRMISNL